MFTYVKKEQKKQTKQLSKTTRKIAALVKSGWEFLVLFHFVLDLFCSLKKKKKKKKRLKKLKIDMS